MKIIRDKEMGAITMLPLLTQWGINRCNLKDCTNKPSTIICGHKINSSKTAPTYGMCEDHWNEYKNTSGKRISLEWD